MSTTLDKLTWVQLIWRALLADGTARDVQIADAFREAVGGVPNLERGRALVHALPADSTFRQRSGIQAIAWLAVRNPEAPSPADLARPQLLAQAMRQAFGALRGLGIDSVGLPRIPAQWQTGQAESAATSWQAVIAAADDAALATGMASVVFGTWSVSNTGREANQAAFRTAWQAHRAAFATAAKQPSHEQLRLAALIALAALLRWSLAGQELQLTRLLALAMLSAGLALALAEAAAWSAAHLGIAPAWRLAGEALAAVLAGLAIEAIVSFNAKDAIRANMADREAPR